MTTSSGSPGNFGSTFAGGGAAASWQRGSAARAVWLGPATEQMLDLAGVVDGSRVLAVAAGAGEEVIVAARRVGPNGLVVATDISDAMLQITAAMARDAGLSNVETQMADAQELSAEPASFDAVICRLGLMFFSDRAAGLAEMRGASKPGGRMAAIVWGSAESNPYLTVPNTHIGKRREAVGLPARPSIAHVLAGPGMLAHTLESAGFTAVSVRPVSHLRTFVSTAEAVQTVISEFPMMQTATGELSESERDATWREIEAGYTQFAGRDRVSIPGEMLLAVGTK